MIQFGYVSRSNSPARARIEAAARAYQSARAAAMDSARRERERQAAQYAALIRARAEAARKRFALGQAKVIVGMTRRVRAIVAEVAASRDVSIQKICSPCRPVPVAAARNEIWYRCRTELHLSYPRIGQMFDRDHTTVLYGCRQHALQHGLPPP